MAAGLRLTQTETGLELTGAGVRLACRVALSRRRSLVVRLDPEAGVEVRAPLGTGRARVERLLAEREAWILATIARWRELGLPRPPRCFAPGEEFLYQGRAYRLELAAGNGRGRARVEAADGRLVVHLPVGLAGGGPVAAAALTRRVVLTWYRQAARAALTPLVARHSAALGVDPPQLIIADQKARWGSCSPCGVLRLNWRLVMAPPELMDYVAAHEVCHLRRLDHSPAFWALVENLVPDWRGRRQRLNQTGALYRL